VLYCYPDETNDALLDVLAEADNVCPYLDIPIQHINADLLRRMHRRGTREDILRCVRGARERGLTLRTSLIVGFPGETEDQFKELLDFAAETGFSCAGLTFSPITGPEGNIEYLAYLSKAPEGAMTGDLSSLIRQLVEEAHGCLDGEAEE
jgi:ribosomal protein S12 methylthiotransferase